jgi:FtsP/CotA-like multicopper oxidase with cupredoxin domain
MIHWHGVRVPNAMDGTELTQRPVAPGESFGLCFPRRPMPAPSGTHAQYRPEVQVDRGLYGPLIVEETRAAGCRGARAHARRLADRFLPAAWTMHRAATSSPLPMKVGLGNWLTLTAAPSRASMPRPTGACGFA